MAISSAVFSILTIICAIVAASTSQFTLETLNFSGGATGRVEFGLAFVRVTDVQGNGALSSLHSYPSFISSNCGSLCAQNFGSASDLASTRLRSSLVSAAGAGGFAEFAWAASVITLAFQTISSISFACVAGGKAAQCPLPACCVSVAGGIVVACAAFFSVIIAAAIGWGEFSGVAAASLSYLGAGLANIDWATALWFGGVGAWFAGLALTFSLVTFICEICRFTCCKRAAVAAPSASEPTFATITSVVVSNPISSSGPVYATGPPAPQEWPQKPPAPQYAAAPGPAFHAPAPAPASITFVPTHLAQKPPGPPPTPTHFAPPAYHAHPTPPAYYAPPPAYHAPPPGVALAPVPVFITVASEQEQNEAPPASEGFSGFEKVRRYAKMRPHPNPHSAQLRSPHFSYPPTTDAYESRG